MKRRRLKTWAKWACTVAAGVCIAAAVVSRFWIVEYTWYAHSGTRYRLVGFGGGLFWVLWGDDFRRYDVALEPGWVVGRADSWYWGTAAEAASAGSRSRGGAGRS